MMCCKEKRGDFIKFIIDLHTFALALTTNKKSQENNCYLFHVIKKARIMCSIISLR